MIRVMCWGLYICCFFFKQKTAYGMRISDWSTDVSSSDLRLHVLGPVPPRLEGRPPQRQLSEFDEFDPSLLDAAHLVRLVESLPAQLHARMLRRLDRKSVV